MKKVEVKKDDIVELTLRAKVSTITDFGKLILDDDDEGVQINPNADIVTSFAIIAPNWWPLKDGDVFQYNYRKIAENRYNSDIFHVINGRAYRSSDGGDGGLVANYYDPSKVELLFRPGIETGTLKLPRL